ncbi:MAG: preprotein translocase subunit SecA [Vicinamibacteria bacterium]|nr:preprotein translocase subunit SecA [Vicinamibacteria bacterium]
MLGQLLTKIFGTKNDRDVKKMRGRIQAITDLESGLRRLSDEELRGKTNEFRARIEAGASLDDILPEAFAVAREGGRRVLNMRHFDVQLIGGMALHGGSIAEMRTGEGKTLVATLPAYLNGLSGKGVHVVTVNDYLAKRDSDWMGRLYKALGLSVACIQHDMSDRDRKAAYAADITYGTNNEFGFDYLRDNMKFELESYVQRGHNFAIVDEVDSILIDEARTPLIISGPAEESTDLYYKVDQIIPKLIPGARISGDKKAEEREELEKTGDYIVDEKARNVTLTDAGMSHAEKLLSVTNLWDPTNMEVLHHVNQGLRAHSLYVRDVNYVVKDGQVIIVDEFTGRLMPGRRWSDGLHQAVEAKEKVKIERENQTLATITLQNYFRMYSKLAGMTGTAETEAPEFEKIYKLEVLVAPTNRPLIRLENPDTVYRTEPEKDRAVVREIKELASAGRPVLVGTISIEKSERLASMLKRDGIKHVVLNAKYHEREADIVSQAGRFGAVTIATNMAGRGTDIILGGIPDVRSRNVLIERGINPDTASAADKTAADEVALAEMAADFKKELSHRKFDSIYKEKLAERYLALVAAFPNDHPSFQIVEALAAHDEALTTYLAAAEALPRPKRNKIAKAFFPHWDVDKPIEFIDVHPLKAEIATVIANQRTMAAIVNLLDTSERERVVVLGGLHILATERHEARRIDHQLRGRAGRQGDIGSSRFYLSLQDDLMRIFGSDRISGLMLKLGMEEDMPVEHPMVSRSIERAQKQVEAQNFAVRKHLLEYDDVMNKQRVAIYGTRRMILEGKETRQWLMDLSEDVIDSFLNNALDPKVSTEGANPEGLSVMLRDTFGLDVTVSEITETPQAELAASLKQRAKAAYETKEREIGVELMQFHQRVLLLQIVDAQWKDHLLSLDHLKEGIGLRSYGQRDPLVEYKKESYNLFQALMDRIEEEALRWVFLYQPVMRRDERQFSQAPATDAPFDPIAEPASPERRPEPVSTFGKARAQPRNLTFTSSSDAPSKQFAGGGASPESRGGNDGTVKTVRREGVKVGRNDPCPCGSGKKYKKCHGTE